MAFYKATECFKLVNDVPQFAYTKILYTVGQDLYQARCNRRLNTAASDPPDLDSLPLTGITKIVPNTYQPEIPADCTIVTNPHVSQYYIKQPNLTYYGEHVDLCQLVLVEIAACEALKRFPHPNIARYHGCQVSEGRVTGICFDKYKETLMEKLNPGALNDNALRLYPHKLPKAQIDKYVAGIDAGLRHLHTHGFVHNDINPHNIMLTVDDVAVIIDFDSCLKEGAWNGQLKQNSWHRGGTSGVANDEEAFQALKEWMYNGCK